MSKTKVVAFSIKEPIRTKIVVLYVEQSVVTRLKQFIKETQFKT